MKNTLLFIIFLSLLNCSPGNSVEGEYHAVKSSIFDAILFENGVAMFKGVIGDKVPASKYHVKNNKVYLETFEGILIFKIIDDYTIKGENSIIKDDVYKKE